ncbi:hypothetical protein G9A89_008452 [Geosiphon pyriformis]|nr:hypothetical protein G9A89_008452 [Geosiphon pyriformis]
MSSKRKTVEWEAITSAVVGADSTIENKRKKIDENQNFIITDVNTCDASSPSRIPLKSDLVRVLFFGESFIVIYEKIAFLDLDFHVGESAQEDVDKEEFKTPEVLLKFTVEYELGQTLPGNRRSRRTSVDSRRSRRSRRRSASPSPPRDAINTNTNNPGAENPEQNIGHSGSIETSSLQPPPPYEAQNNFSEINQSHVVSNREVAVSGNIPSSQNDSDVSMHDVGDSQTFSNMESINEEVG